MRRKSKNVSFAKLANNTLQHYKRVVSAMEVARWQGIVDFEAFSDRDRAMCGYTHFEKTDLEDKQEEAKEKELFQSELKRYVKEEL